MKTKKVQKLCCVSVAIILAVFFWLSSISCVASASRAVRLPLETEDYLCQLLESMSRDEGIEFKDYKYVANRICLASGREIGYVVDFSIADSRGYAICLEGAGNMQIAEVSSDGHSPFYGKVGRYIYPSLGRCFLETEEGYYDLSTGEKHSSLNLENDDMFYVVGDSSDKKNIREDAVVTYNWRHIYSYAIPNFYFNYRTGLTGQTNNCANAAGVILLNYWNMRSNNDMLKLTHNQMNANGRNMLADPVALGYMQQFYITMGTNWLFSVAGGTLPSSLYQGFNTVVAIRQDFMTLRQMR